MQKKIRVGIIGGAGYTGGELIRILLNHPQAEIMFVQRKSNAGNTISSVHEDIFGEKGFVFADVHHFEIDVLFFCGGHGEAKKFIENNDISVSIKLIDIGNDFRLQNDAEIKGRKFIYGLPEINKAAIINADSIANPGCFATAIQLGLLPLADKKILKEVYTTGITGSTGGGQSLSATGHFSWRANNIQSYKTLAHQHLGEIEESLLQLQQEKVQVNFVPWRGDFTRGIFVSSQTKSNLNLDELNTIYQHFYKDNPFVFVSDSPINLKPTGVSKRSAARLVAGKASHAPMKR